MKSKVFMNISANFPNNKKAEKVIGANMEKINQSQFRKEFLRAMIISSYKDNIITLKEYTDMIRELDKR